MLTDRAATSVRLIHPSDAGALSRHLIRDKAAVAHWMPDRPRDFHTEAGQAERIETLLTGHHAGTGWPGVIVENGDVIGQVSVSTIIRGPFQRGSLGYWVATTSQNMGHASRAVGLTLKIATDELGLYKIEAHTQIDNLASQKVLRNNGFVPYGVAREHIFIDGAWRDDLLWEQTLISGPLKRID
jgi:ribosomal-protein-alanine N-acetyltransferase